jgi:hypothetical protein
MIAVAVVLIGLLDVPLIYEPGQPVVVHAQPFESAPPVARLTSAGIARGDGSCSWKRDLNDASVARGCTHTESAYEVPAIAVFERRGGWFRIALDDDARSFGWVTGAPETFHSVADLLGSGTRLTYLTGHWDRRLYATPAGTASVVPQSERDIPYQARESRVIDGRLWLRIDVLDQVCGDRDPRVVRSGWVPAQGPNGESWAWFHSRGC